MSRNIKKILIANRGEIAIRIARTCRELGIKSVAVHSEADATSLHVRLADEAICIGPNAAIKSYLNIAAIIAAAEVSGADAIHPGYGFLSENTRFAEACRRCGIIFIGPSPEAMQTWGNKISARRHAKQFRIPQLPGSARLIDAKHVRNEADRIGFPVILKSAGGGGGRGMRIVRDVHELEQAFYTAQNEAMRAFGNPDLYVERYVEEPKHIEFQLIVDQHKNARCLGDRECSLQRKHQKIIEEAPSTSLSSQQRSSLHSCIEEAMNATGYEGVGTVEFLLDPIRQELYFMEVNTRLQVEHPVTEMVSGLDLVAEQIQVAMGETFRFSHRNISTNGHAIECRINAEDPYTCTPSPGLITDYHSPGGYGVRVDSGIYQGWKVPPYYDSLMAKLIVHADTRTMAIQRMQRALYEFTIHGVHTNIPLHQHLLNHPEVLEGRMTTRTVERVLAALNSRELLA